MSKNVSSFISKLDKLHDKTIDVFVPSLKKKVPTKPLNLKQQKLASDIIEKEQGKQLDKEKLASQILKQGIQ